MQLKLPVRVRARDLLVAWIILFSAITFYSLAWIRETGKQGRAEIAATSAAARADLCVEIEKVKEAQRRDIDRRIRATRAFTPTRDVPQEVLDAAIDNLEETRSDLDRDPCQEIAP